MMLQWFFDFFFGGNDESNEIEHRSEEDLNVEVEPVSEDDLEDIDGFIKNDYPSYNENDSGEYRAAGNKHRSLEPETRKDEAIDLNRGQFYNPWTGEWEGEH